MTVRKEMSEIVESLEANAKQLENIIQDYMENYADYGWDSFTETMANVAAQIYMQAIICRNAIVKQDHFR